MDTKHWQAEAAREISALYERFVVQPATESLWPSEKKIIAIIDGHFQDWMNSLRGRLAVK